MSKKIALVILSRRAELAAQNARGLADTLAKARKDNQAFREYMRAKGYDAPSERGCIGGEFVADYS